MNILGIMSGTSLDGVDLALCEISNQHHKIIAAQTVPYSQQWQKRLSEVENGSAFDLSNTHIELGHYLGQLAHNFLQEQDIQADAIASHGHTIFHQPNRGITIQIGDGNAIAAETGLKVVCNFRALDVALGGQGAPLVPMGDAMLFPEYDACLNLGGIANISFESEQGRIAYDICPCNIVLNRLANELGLLYDPEGDNARRGLMDYYLLQTLDRLEYYRLMPPKSLGKEWVIDNIWPILSTSGLPVVDKLRTVCEHIAKQVSIPLSKHGIQTLLLSGGGAHNKFLVETITALSPTVGITLPDKLTIDYKEALIFAFLGYLRLTEQVNTLKSVTGARFNSISGDICGLAEIDND